jgi:hypothetical protein
LFFTTKVPGFGDSYSFVQKDIAELGIKQVDLVLLHMPENTQAKIAEQWSGLEKARFFYNGCTRACLPGVPFRVLAVDTLQFATPMKALAARQPTTLSLSCR